MTTGRINQVTIVCRGWPPAPEGAGEIFQVTGGESESRAARSVVGRANYAALGNPLSPSRFPRASVRRTEPAVGGVAWGPQEEDRARYFYHCGVRSGRLPPDAQVSGVASGHPSTEPICQQRGRAHAAVSQASPVRGLREPLRGGRRTTSARSWCIRRRINSL